MNKKNDSKPQHPAFVEELLKKGTVTLTAIERDEFDALLADIPADVRYGAGAVGRNSETGVLSLRIDLITE